MLTSRSEITVRDGKGEKDRITMLPRSIDSVLELHLKDVKRLHEQDLKAGHGEVYLPYALDRKYRNAAHEYAWQYLFPTRRCRLIREQGNAGGIIS